MGHQKHLLVPPPSWLRLRRGDTPEDAEEERLGLVVEAVLRDDRCLEGHAPRFIADVSRPEEQLSLAEVHYWGKTPNVQWGQGVASAPLAAEELAESVARDGSLDLDRVTGPRVPRDSVL